MAILNHGSSIRTTDGGQTTSTIVTAANIGSYAVASNATYYIGTTQNVFNRASGAQTLTGVSIDGNAANITAYTINQNVGTGNAPSFTGMTSTAMLVASTSMNSVDDWQNSPISIRERGLVAAAQSANTYSPNLNFHWASRISNSLWMDANGNLSWGSYDGTGVPSSDGAFYTNNLYASIYFDKNNTVYYLDAANSGTSLLVAGNIGAGLTSPLHKIQATGLISASDATYNNDSTFIGAILNNDGTNPGLDLRRWNGGGAGTNNHGATYIATNSVGDTIFYNGLIAANTRATNEKMRIAVNGNVGMGTTSPSYKLDVVGSVRATTDNNFSFVQQRSATNTWCGLGYLTGASSKWFVGLRETGDDNLRWYNYTNSSERMVLTESGNVGIGTTSPTYKLDVSGTARIANDMLATGNITIGKSAAYLILDGTNSDAEIYWRANSSNRWAAGMNVGDATENFNIYNYTTATTNFTILKASGNVGIGSTNPSQKLHVVGTGFASTDFRAPIFYDSDNTTYYLDPNASTSGNLFGVLKQNDGKFVRDSYFRTISGTGDYYASGASGWYTVASITLTTNCTGGVLYGTLYDNRYDGADAYQISIVARAECDFTTNNESHYVNVGCTILGSTGITNYQSKIRVLLVASSANSRTYEVQFFETSWNRDTWQLETGGSPVWTIYSTAQAPGTSTGTARVFYISNKNADNIRANTASYSPIYYDSNDTSYYLDAAGTSRLNTTRIGNINVGSGTYLNTITPIGDTNINLSSPSGAFYFDTFPRMPGFYDSANTAYYIDPASTSIVNSFKVYDALYFGDYTTYLSQATPYLRITTANGYGNFGPANSSWFHMTTDRPNFYMAVGLHINGDLFIYNTQSQLTSTSVRAPIFYDSGDTTYYLDPANTGTALAIAGNAGVGTASPTLSSGKGIHINSSSGHANLKLQSSGRTWELLSTTGAYFSVYDTTGGADRLAVTSAGNVGVATTSADTNLQVVGHVHVGNQTTFDNTGGWNKTIYLDGTVHARMRIIGSAFASGKNSQTETNIWVDNSVAPYSGLTTNAGSFTINAGFTTLTNSARSPIFYDSDNTSYYLDPASTSNLVGLTVANTITGSISGNAATATTSLRSTIEDTRAAQRTPNDYDDYRASYEFTNAITGLGDWHSAFTLQGWHNGYAAWQIIGPASTSAHENFYLRSGVNTTWNAVRTILHSGNYNSYSPTLTGTGASGTWSINVTGNAGGSSASCTGNAATATTSSQLGGVAAANYVRNDVDGTDSTALFRLTTITKSLTITTSWLDTGIVGANLATGCYMISVYVDNYAVNGGHYQETYTGMMSWFSTGTNATDYDEIVLHKSGHAPNGAYINLRTIRQLSGSTNLKLQIISSVSTSGASNYVFKFRRLI